jgi:hypothetical protein
MDEEIYYGPLQLPLVGTEGTPGHLQAPDFDATMWRHALCNVNGLRIQQLGQLENAHVSQRPCGSAGVVRGAPWGELESGSARLGGGLYGSRLPWIGPVRWEPRRASFELVPRLMEKKEQEI